MEFSVVVFTLLFVVFFLLNGAIAAFASRRIMRLALIASALSPFAFLIYLYVKNAFENGIASSVNDPKIVPLLLEVVIPFAICAAIGAMAAQFVVGRLHNRGAPQRQ